MVWMGGWAPTNGGVSSTGAADGSYRLLDSGDWSWVDMCSVYSEGLWMCTVHDQCRSLSEAPRRTGFGLVMRQLTLVLLISDIWICMRDHRTSDNLEKIFFLWFSPTTKKNKSKIIF